MKQEMYDVSPQYKHNTIFLLSRVYILELCFPIFYTCHLNLFLYTRHISILYIIRHIDTQEALFNRTFLHNLF